MGAAEFREWMLFDELYGLPDAYLVAAAICTTLEGCWIEKPRDVAQILPYFSEATGGRSAAELASRFQALASRVKSCPS